jgi:molybdopterin converting factor small subunit
VNVVRIPPTLRSETGGERQVSAQGTTVRELLDDLMSRFPGLRAQLVEEDEIAPFVNVYLEGEDVRTLAAGLESPVREGATVILLPAMAGGCFEPRAGGASRPAEPASGAASRR